MCCGQVLAPYDAEDARGLLKAAIRDPDPVVFLENEILYGEAFPVDDKILDKDFVLPIGKVKVTALLAMALLAQHAGCERIIPCATSWLLKTHEKLASCRCKGKAQTSPLLGTARWWATIWRLQSNWRKRASAVR